MWQINSVAAEVRRLANDVPLYKVLRQSIELAYSLHAVCIILHGKLLIRREP